MADLWARMCFPQSYGRTEEITVVTERCFYGFLRSFYGFSTAFLRLFMVVPLPLGRENSFTGVFEIYGKLASFMGVYTSTKK